jgi:hypothetical protein
MLIKSTIVGCVVSAVLMLIVSVTQSDPVPPGFLEGHAKIFPLGDANLADDGKVAPGSEAPYPEYPLVVLTRDGKKEITRVTPDRNGNYRVELPPGDYILDVAAHTRKRSKPRPFTVVSDQTVRVDMDIDTGIR